MAAYEEKMAARAAKEAASGRKPGGRPPQEPQPGPHPKDQVNFTDPESRIMPSSEGFVQGFNAQAAVDDGSHLIVAGHVTDACNDKQQVAPALEQLAAVEAVIGKPEGILADTGYFSADNVAQCEMAEVTPYIASGRDAHNQPLANRQAPAPALPVDANPAARAKHRMKTPEGKAIYSRRKVTVETVFGIIKEVMGFRRFHLRGMDADQPGMELEADARPLKLSKKRKSALTGPETVPSQGPKRPLGVRGPTRRPNRPRNRATLSRDPARSRVASARISAKASLHANSGSNPTDS